MHNRANEKMFCVEPPTVTQSGIEATTPRGGVMWEVPVEGSHKIKRRNRKCTVLCSSQLAPVLSYEEHEKRIG
jgi:hypothetical protein